MLTEEQKKTWREQIKKPQIGFYANNTVLCWYCGQFFYYPSCLNVHQCKKCREKLEKD